MAKGSERMKEHIKEYLDAYAEKNEGFFFDYQNPDKNIDECCDFICTQVQKMGAIGLDDDDVFGLAIHYYQETNPGEITKGVASRVNVVVNRQVQLTDEEIAQAKQKALDNITAKEMKRIQEKEKREKEKAKAEAEKKREELAAEGVLSLF